MCIFPLQQALCSDRSQISAGPEPAEWIIPSLPEGWRLVSFHFFVDWSSHPPDVADRIWMTRQVRLDFNDDLTDVSSDLLSEFLERDLRGEFEILAQAGSSVGCKVSVILLPDIPVSFISDKTPAWVITRPDNQDYKVNKITIADLKKAIQRHSGGPVQVGSKGLIYGTSAVECYLSRSDAAFPGDVDAVIIDHQNRVRCIIEYKKHTKSEPVGEHLMARYYPRPDGRKYQRLFALAKRCEQFSSKQNVPLFVLYYSTKKPVIRLQEIVFLDEYGVTIGADTGDRSIAGYDQKEISDLVVRWLRVC